MIAGAQRSCSTSLAELFARHPQVSMLRREFLALEDPYYPHGVDELLAHVDRSVARGLVPGVKRPELLHREEGPVRARRHLPAAVVVVVLREPVGRSVSAYHHYVRHGVLPALHPDVGIPGVLDQMARGSASSVGAQVVAYSRYSGGLRRLRDAFGDRLLVFFQEEMLLDTAHCTGRIMRLLGIEPMGLGELPRVNVGNYSIRPFRLSRIGGRIGYEHDDRSATFSVTKRPVRRLAARACFALDRFTPTRSDSAPQLSSITRDRLVEALAGDAEALREILGRPLPRAWTSSLSI